MYLFSEFFESKAVSHLLGEGVEAHHLNDDRLGRVLDQRINLEGQPQISNLSDERRLIIRLFGPPVERYYYPSG